MLNAHRITRAAIPAALLALAASFPASAITCDTCGTVVDTRTVTQKGEAHGGGAVIGGIAGGVLGHQIGSGRGNDLATIAGAAGGAYAGHQIEKSRNSTTKYQVVVKLDNGTSRTFNFSKPTRYKAGDPIKVVDNKLMRQ